MEWHYSLLKKLLRGIVMSSPESKGRCSSSGQHKGAGFIGIDAEASGPENADKMSGWKREN